MDDRSLVVRPGSEIRETKKDFVDRWDCKDFAPQCERDEVFHVPLYAEDYNNWGCCLCWQGDCETAEKKWLAGLSAPCRDQNQKAQTEKALSDNFKRCDPPPIELRAFIEEVEQRGDMDLAESLRQDWGLDQ